MAYDHDSMTESPPENMSTDMAPRQDLEEKNHINDMQQHDAVPRANDDEDYPTALKLVSVVVALVLAVFLASLDMNIIATAIPRITDQFHSLDDVQIQIRPRTFSRNPALTSSRSAGTARPCS